MGQVKSTSTLPEKNWMTPASIAFTSDSRAIVVIADDSLVTIQAADGSSVVKRPKDGPDRRAVFLPALNRVLAVRRAAAGDSEIATWNPATEDPPTLVKLDGIKGSITAFSFSANGKVLAVCPDNLSAKSQITLHDSLTGKVTGQLPVDDAANYRNYSSLVLSPDGQYLAGIGAGDIVQPKYDSVDLFRVSSGKRLYHINSGASPPATETFANALTFTADSKSLYYVQKYNNIIGLDTETGNVR